MENCSFATILSCLTLIISVGTAVYHSRQSTKECNRKIEAMEKCFHKEITEINTFIRSYFMFNCHYLLENLREIDSEAKKIIDQLRNDISCLEKTIDTFGESSAENWDDKEFIKKYNASTEQKIKIDTQIQEKSVLLEKLLEKQKRIDELFMHVTNMLNKVTNNDKLKKV